MSFSLILVILAAVSGVAWLIQKALMYFSNTKKTNFLLDQAASFFPIFILVIVIRSFIVEPFRIPSGSLEPSLLIGDFVVVNKFAYGLRLPVLETKVLALGEPKRGDIVVFRWPPSPQFDYIKRVVGVPGDTVSYRDKVLKINGQVAQQTFIKYTNFVNQYGQASQVKELEENLLGIKHDIFVNDNDKPYDFEITVPKGYYFMMGDNRDNSSDSRYWGLVPEANLRGPAFLVWMSWDGQNNRIRWQRIGRAIH